MWIRHTRGNAGLSAQVNKIARTKKAVVFEIYSYLSVLAWLVFALPLLDFMTFSKFVTYQDGGLQSYFGWMTSQQASVYFVLMMMNIIGAKAFMTLAELAGMLRRTRVLLISRGMFLIWEPEN